MITPDKFYICTIVGTIAAALFGGWDGAMLTLCIFMAVDYLSGVVLAGVFKKSPKSESGALDSKAGLFGLFRKAGMLCIVIVAVRLDMLCSMDGVLRTGVIFALVANEAISITENIGAMGVPLPRSLMRAIERLRENTDEDSDDDDTGENLCEDPDENT